MRNPFTKIPVYGPESEEQKREEEVEQMMKEWYPLRSGDQSLVKKQRGWKSLLFVFLLFLVVAVLGGLSIYFAIEGRSFPFKRGIGAETDPLLLTITAPSAVNSGEKIDLVVTYQNVSKVRLTDIELQIFFPENFVFLESVPYKPYNAGQNYWRLPTVEPVSSNKLTISGQVVGVAQEQKRVEAVFLYKPTNFHTQFKKTESAVFLVNESVLAITLDGPDTLLPKQELQYTITVQNTAEAPLEDIVVLLSLPKEFLITSAGEEIEEKIWNIPSLAAGDARELKLAGMLNARGGDLITFKAEAGIRERGQFLLQNYTTILATVIDPEIRLLVGRLDKEEPLIFGGAVQVEASVENASTLNIADGSLDIVIADTNDVLLWNTIKVERPYAYELIDAGDEGKKSKVLRIKDIQDIPSSDLVRIPFVIGIIKVPYDIDVSEYTVGMKPVFTGRSSDISVPLRAEGEAVEFLVKR